MQNTIRIDKTTSVKYKIVITGNSIRFTIIVTNSYNVRTRIPYNVRTRIPYNVRTRIPYNVRTRIPYNVRTRIPPIDHSYRTLF